ncbi:MAG: hypothetical protein ACHQUC_01510 [Chlamydiales bacterium]
MHCQFHTNFPFLDPHVHQQLRPIFEHLDNSPPHYRTMIQQLATHASELTATEISYALNCILGVAVIEQHRDALITISDETIRSRRINELTGLIIEPGLVIGDNPSDINECIAFRVNELVSTYLFDVDKNDTLSFFRDAFKGPPCLNGRFITLEVYRCNKQLFISIEEFVKETQQKFPSWTLPYTDKNIDPDAVVLEELIYEYMDGRDSRMPSEQEFIQHFHNNEIISNLYKDEARFKLIYQRAIAICSGY